MQSEAERITIVPEGQKVKKKKTFLPFLIILFLLVSAGAVVFFLFFSEDSYFEQGEEVGQMEPRVGGYMFLTLSPVDEDKINVYRLDLRKMELEEYLSTENGEYNFMNRFSPDLSKMVYVIMDVEGLSSIVLRDETTQGTKLLVEPSNLFPRNPVFSLDGEKIVYWVLEEGRVSSDEIPEDNSIYVMDLDGEREKVANGAFPLFSPDGSDILFLKSDGLYTFDLVSKQENFVLDINVDYGEEIEEKDVNLADWHTFRFNYDYNSNILIITDSLFSGAYFFNVNSWENFDVELVSDFEVHGANWPIFSPDSEFFATQEFDPETEIPIISVYKLEDSEHQLTFELNDFEIDYIWLSDWIK